MKRGRYDPKFHYRLTTVLAGVLFFTAGFTFHDALFLHKGFSLLSAYAAAFVGTLALVVIVRAWYTQGYSDGVHELAKAIDGKKVDVAIDVTSGEFGGVTLAPGESKTFHFRVPIRPFGDRGRNN